MDFGALPTRELKKVKFELPKDPPGNNKVLSTGTGKGKIFLGCAKWGRKEWIGKIYPSGAKEKDFLTYYGQHYDSIELNATHYKLYHADRLKEWKAQVNKKDFKFCPKAHRGMSFLKHSPAKPGITKDFLREIRAFKENLGPIFITHDEKIKWDTQGEREFYEYLDSLPKDLQFFVEERWPGFYADKELMKRYYARLTELRVGTIITDAAGRRDVLHMRLTVPKAFIRFVGNSLHPSDYPRIDDWARRIKKWLQEGIDEVYFFMHMHDEGKSPELTQYVVNQFNKVCKLSLNPVEFIS